MVKAFHKAQNFTAVLTTTRHRTPTQMNLLDILKSHFFLTSILILFPLYA
jgi:hypothetical protein